MNPYEVLGLEPDATRADVKKAFRKLAQKYHPDKSDGDESVYLEAQEAYNILYDEERRRAYDETGETGEPKKIDVDVLVSDVFVRVINEIEFVEDIAKSCHDILNSAEQAVSAELLQARTDKSKLLALLGRVVTTGETNLFDKIVSAKVDAQESIIRKCQKANEEIILTRGALNSYADTRKRGGTFQIENLKEFQA
jgi:DnaJ-class molecular chaperone